MRFWEVKGRRTGAVPMKLSKGELNPTAVLEALDSQGE